MAGCGDLFFAVRFEHEAEPGKRVFHLVTGVFVVCVWLGGGRVSI